MLGALSFTPLVLVFVALQASSFWFFTLGAVAVILSLLISSWLAIVGFRRGFRWMLVWLVAFVVFVPFANIAFWFFHRHRLA
jgi:hypothetical protein